MFSHSKNYEFSSHKYCYSRCFGQHIHRHSTALELQIIRTGNKRPRDMNSKALLRYSGRAGFFHAAASNPIYAKKKEVVLCIKWPSDLIPRAFSLLFASDYQEADTSAAGRGEMKTQAVGSRHCRLSGSEPLWSKFKWTAAFWMPFFLHFVSLFFFQPL